MFFVLFPVFYSLSSTHVPVPSLAHATPELTYLPTLLIEPRARIPGAHMRAVILLATSI